MDHQRQRWDQPPRRQITSPEHFAYSWLTPSAAASSRHALGGAWASATYRYSRGSAARLTRNSSDRHRLPTAGRTAQAFGGTRRGGAGDQRQPPGAAGLPADRHRAAEPAADGAAAEHTGVTRSMAAISAFSCCSSAQRTRWLPLNITALTPCRGSATIYAITLARQPDCGCSALHTARRPNPSIPVTASRTTSELR